MKARKLPSGSWRAELIVGYEIRDGKRKAIRKSFTARTKRDAERLALNWKNDAATCENMFVIDAIDRYIQLKESALSPSTIRGYRSLTKNMYDSIGAEKLASLDAVRIQLWISELVPKYSAKSVKNAFQLLSAALKMFRPNFSPVVSLPQAKQDRYNLPDNDQIDQLITYAQEHKLHELYIALMLGRYCGMRRSEICAITSDDIRDGMLTISKAVVKDDWNVWHTKAPKTQSSVRRIPLPPAVLEAVAGIEGPIITCSPDALLGRFYRAIKYSKVEPFSFHGLRHAFASNAMLAGVPDVYIEAMGGWRHGSTVLKTVYQNATEAEAAAQMRRLFEQNSAMCKTG